MLSLYLFLAFSGAVSASCNSSGPLNTTTTAEGCACEKLSATYPEYLYSPDSTNYTTVNLEAWDTRSNLMPTCIFNPVTADQVADGMSIISKCDAQFAIRGGGHMNYPGANNINEGVMLALSGLKAMQISADNSTVEVGPGLRWFDVYSYLEPYGRLVIGGRLKTIGVPGLTLIGGVHYFTNKYGYAMDNVVSYDVVLGNGTQVTATASSNSDLFWALKGGANNFGIVTKFIFQTFAIPQVSTTIQMFNESGVQSFIKAACDLAQADDASVGAGAVVTINYNATTKVASASLLGVQEGTESPPSRFANFSSIPADRVTNNVSSMATFASQLDSPLQMFRVKFGHHTMKVDADQLYSFYQIWKAAVDEIADVDGLYPTFVLNLDPASANTVAKKNGVGNVWGADDNESTIWYQTSTGWNLAKDDLRVQTWSHQLTAKLYSLNQAKGISEDFIYMGDAGEDQDPWVGIPAENLEKMKTIRAKYDVGGVFTYLNWGGFKLPY